MSLLRLFEREGGREGGRGRERERETERKREVSCCDSQESVCCVSFASLLLPSRTKSVLQVDQCKEDAEKQRDRIEVRRIRENRSRLPKRQVGLAGVEPNENGLKSTHILSVPTWSFISRRHVMGWST